MSCDYCGFHPGPGYKCRSCGAPSQAGHGAERAGHVAAELMYGQASLARLLQSRQMSAQDPDRPDANQLANLGSLFGGWR